MPVSAFSTPSLVSEQNRAGMASATGMVGRPDRGRLGVLQVLAVALAVACAVVVFGYGLVGSYATVSVLAAHRGLPLASFVPAGIDGGLLSVVLLDLVLAWIGSPVGWLRQLVRLLSAGTIAANGVTGWPDPVAVSLHTAAPVMVLALVEAGRTVLLRRLGLGASGPRDAIPAARWLLAPWRTVLLWRRMVLWQITSYRDALDTELAVRRATTTLRLQYGRRWRRRAPGDIVWMLRTGTNAPEACTRINHTSNTPARPDSDTPATSRPANEQCTPAMKPPRTPGTPDVNVELPRFDDALALNREHWQTAGRPISAETLRKRLHIGTNLARSLHQAIRAADQATLTRTACGESR